MDVPSTLLRHAGGCLQPLKGYQQVGSILRSLDFEKKELIFDRFLTFNSLRPASEELLSPEITAETDLCY